MRPPAPAPGKRNAPPGPSGPFGGAGGIPGEPSPRKPPRTSTQQSITIPLHPFVCSKVSNGCPKISNRVSAPIADELRRARLATASEVSQLLRVIHVRSVISFCSNPPRPPVVTAASGRSGRASQGASIRAFEPELAGVTKHDVARFIDVLVEH
jgi:hypothetical protein